MEVEVVEVEVEVVEVKVVEVEVEVPFDGLSTCDSLQCSPTALKRLRSPPKWPKRPLRVVVREARVSVGIAGRGCPIQGSTLSIAPPQSEMVMLSFGGHIKVAMELDKFWPKNRVLAHMKE